jgi:predicted MPP superfamily phosphohydrolase
MKKTAKVLMILLGILCAMIDLVEFRFFPVIFLIAGLLLQLPWQYYVITIGGYFAMFFLLNLRSEDKLRKFITILLIIISLGLGFLIYVPTSLVNTHTYTSNLIVDKEHNLLKAKENKEIKILQLTDIQVSNFLFAGYAFDIVKNTIKKAQPDLLVLTGDNITSKADERLLNKFATFMDSFELPWALIYGNHDYVVKVPIEKQNEVYENTKYGLFKTGNVKDHNGNYYYNIERNNEVIYSLIFTDSKYDGFTIDHINWYKDTINQITTSNNKIIPSILFSHIPPKGLAKAYEAYLKDNNIGYGSMNEDLSLQKTDPGIYEKALELKSTKMFVYGHDHINTLVINYNDIMFCYGLKTGRTTYYNRHMNGGTLYTITLDNTINIKRIYC